MEEEAEESDRQSSDGISGSESEEESEHDDDDDSEDSDDAGGEWSNLEPEFIILLWDAALTHLKPYIFFLLLLLSLFSPLPSSFNRPPTIRSS